MARWNLSTLFLWAVLSTLILAILFILPLTSQLFSFSPVFTCSTEYIESDSILYSGFDLHGNQYLVIDTNHFEFPEINSSYPYSTTLPIFPEGANRDIYAIAKFSASKDLLWAKLIGNDDKSPERLTVRAVDITSEGGLILAGRGYGMIDSKYSTHTYGEGPFGAFVLKLTPDGQIDFMTTWKAEFPFVNQIRIEGFGPYVFFQGRLLDTRIQTINNFANLTNNDLHTLTSFGQQGEIKWVTYIPGVDIWDTDLTDQKIGFVLRDLNGEFTESNSKTPWILFEISKFDGSVISKDQVELEQLLNANEVLLTLSSIGESFRISIVDKKHQSIYFVEPSVPDFSEIEIFSQGMTGGLFMFMERNNYIMVLTQASFPLSPSPLVGESIEVTWVNQLTDTYFVVLNPEGNLVGQLRIQSDTLLINPSFDFYDGNFLIATHMSSPPFPLGGSFQPDPLGEIDAFVATISQNTQTGTFYGNIGLPSLICP